MTGAYKERGALNKLLLMPTADRERGLIAASAGNHAQAVAYHAGRLGVKATIVMPEATPIMKVANTRAHGARVVLHGANYDEAYAEARRLEQVERLTFVHPFDDPDIIAGQGTIALEVLAQEPEADAIVVPIGGGGLVSGIAVATKALRPAAQVIGVETEVLPCMLQAVEAGAPVTLDAGEHHRRRHRGEARGRSHPRARPQVRGRDRHRLGGGDRERDPVPAREGEDRRRGGGRGRASRR